MDWLRAILEKAEIKDGKVDVDGVLTAVNSEFAKHAVPKSVFNDKVNELKTANQTINDLKGSNTENETLQGKIKDYEKEVTRLKTEAANTAKTYALKAQLAKAGVTDADYLIYKKGGIEKFTFDSDGKPVGLDDALKPFKSDKTYAHLFESAQSYSPKSGGGNTVKNPWAKETFNLTEQGQIFKNDPAKAKEMMIAAGVEI